MTQAIDRPGAYRGKPLDWGVSETRNGYPQMILRLQATEFYDETGELTGGEPGWVNWADYEQEITAYVVLYTQKDGKWEELLNAKQVKKVFGWTGLDFESLAEGKWGETILLFRVDPNEYNGQTTLKVQWIDTADASPVKQLPKYDTAKLKGLTAKMSGALSASAPAPVAAKPTTAKPAVPPKGKPGPKPKADPTPAGSPANPAAAKPAALSTATPPPASPAPAPAAPSVALAQKPLTKDSAWAICVQMKAAKVSDDLLAEAWIAEATKIGKPEDQFTSIDWFTVKEGVLALTSVF